MGPRRKISVAVNEYKTQRDVEEAESSDDTGSKTPELQNEERSTKPEKASITVRANRPKLMKQASTELTVAYREVRTVCD